MSCLKSELSGPQDGDVEMDRTGQRQRVTCRAAEEDLEVSAGQQPLAGGTHACALFSRMALIGHHRDMEE